MLRISNTICNNVILRHARVQPRFSYFSTTTVKRARMRVSSARYVQHAHEKPKGYDVSVARKNNHLPLSASSPGAPSPKYKGVYADEATGQWRAVLTVGKEKVGLGLFPTEKEAADAHLISSEMHKLEKAARRRPRLRRGDRADHQPSTAAPPAQAQNEPPAPPVEVRRSSYMGVIQEGDTTLWEAVITVNGKDISGGEYETELEAAKAYDALARMYQGVDAATNFPSDPYTSWLPPDAVATVGQIETKPGLPLTVDEIVEALKQERGVDVRVQNIVGISDLAEWMVYVTGNSVPHMQKMADTIARAVRKRRLPGIDAGVEARDMDDWMVVDCGNIIVNVFDAEAREVFDIEQYYESMRNGNPYANITYEEWLARNPLPEKWMRRLAKDEAEAERQQLHIPPPSAAIHEVRRPRRQERRNES